MKNAKYAYNSAKHRTYIFKIGNEYAQIVACSSVEARKRCEALSLNNLKRQEMKLDANASKPPKKPKKQEIKLNASESKPKKLIKLIDISLVSICATAKGKDCDCVKYKNAYGSDFFPCVPIVTT